MTSTNNMRLGSLPTGQNWNYEPASSNTLFNAQPFPSSNMNYSGGHPHSSNGSNGVNLGMMPPTGSSPPSSDFLDELNKDVQIKMLKERLEFTERLLEEKDKQLENYKKLVDSLRDVISDMGQRRPQTLQTSVSANAVPTITRAPPGFESAPPVTTPSNSSAPKHTSIKGRRAISYAPDIDSSYRSFTREDLEAWKKKDNELNLNSSNPSTWVRREDELPYPRKSPSLEYVHDHMAVGSGNPRVMMSSPASQVSQGEEGFGFFSNSSSNSTQHPRTLHKSNSNLETTRSSPPLSVSPKPTTTSQSIFFTEQPPQPQPIVTPPIQSTNSASPISVPSPIKKTVNFGAAPTPISNLPLMLRSSAPVLEGLPPDFYQELAQMEKNAKSPHNQPSLSASVSFSMESPMEKAVTQPVSNGAPVSPSSSGEKNNKLKKSISMPSVYSTSEEPKLLELNQMIGQIYQLSKYQQGCRFLQKRLEEKIAPNTEIIFNELCPHLVELMMDPFGNYLFTKLMECGSSTQRAKILSKIHPEVLSAAFDMYGSQSLQKIMPFLSDQQIEKVVEALKTNTLGLIKHAKANYLIQYCLEHLSPKHNQWIYDSVCSHMIEIACDRVGCVIVKRCIDFAADPQLKALIAEAERTLLVLVQDPFGNYVIQHVIQKYPKEPFTSSLIRALLGNLTDLCVQKFSSNVVEKCLETADADTKRFMLEEITNSDLLPQLLNDRYANFVIQTALDVAEPTERQALVLKIIPHLGKHFSPFTKRLQKKILPLI